MDHNIINMLLSAHQEYTSKTDAIDEFQVTKYNSESPQSLNPCKVKLCWTKTPYTGPVKSHWADQIIPGTG